MIKPARYACKGNMYTVKEVARMLGVSSETVRIRLNKYGGNMQKVWDHYAKAERPGREETAVNEIMSALGMDITETEDDETAVGEVSAPEAPQCEPERNEAERTDEAPETPGETPELPMDAAPLAALRRLNAAIDALSGLYETDVGALAHDTARFIGELRAYRARTYEKYVDWNEVAKG